MRPRLSHAVPSDLRNLERPPVERPRVLPDLARNDAEAIRVVLVAMAQQYLDADADAEKRLARARDVVTQNLCEPQAMQIFHRGAGCANTRQDHTLGRAESLGLVGYFAPMPQKFECASNAGKIARPVVDDRYHSTARRPAGMRIIAIMCSSQQPYPVVRRGPKEPQHKADGVTLSESCCSEWVPVPGFFGILSQAQNDNLGLCRGSLRGFASPQWTRESKSP